MTCNPYLIDRRATCVGDLQTTFCLIDAKRYEFLAAILAEAGRPHAAEMAASFASEHRMLADRLSGAVAIGAEEDDNPFANAEFAPPREDRKVRS